jgi:hypothetical protein
LLILRSNEGFWPYDQAGYVFILRAVGEVGRYQFNDAWTGRERFSRPTSPLPLWYDANEATQRSAIALLRSHPNEPQTKPTTDHRYSELKPIRVMPGVVVDHRPRERYEAARDISLKLYQEAVPAIKRLETIIETMAAWLRSGELVSALRPQAGGAVGEPLPATIWQTERWRSRFFRGQMNPNNIFGTTPRGPSHQWIDLPYTG